jgi:hypothetical protein
LEPAEVLELIRSAPQRYDTVRAALRYRGYGSTIKAFRDRYLASEAGSRPGIRPDPPRKATALSPTVPSGGAAECGTRALAPVVVATASS